MDDLKQFCTARQWEVLQALETAGTERSAALALGCTRNVISQVVKAVKAKAAASGWSPDNDMTKPVPIGYRIKGISTLYSDGLVKAQWVKSEVDKGQEDALLQAAVEALTEDLPKVRGTKGPKDTEGALRALYPIGDHHIGLLAWGEETLQGDYDLKISEMLLMRAMDHLVTVTPACDTAMILVLGDFLHYDSFSATTQSGHLLDADSRFPRMVRVAMRVLRYLITVALKRHKSVQLVVQQGNHDPSSTVFLREAFHHIYENEDRLEVDTAPRTFSCHQFGKNLIGTHHGDKVKLPQLPLLFATDYPKIWGATEHRVILTGHVHHDQILLKEFSGATVESVRILAPKDAYATNGGWRAMQTMTARVLHKEYGEVSRSTFSPAMIDD